MVSMSERPVGTSHQFAIDSDSDAAEMNTASGPSSPAASVAGSTAHRRLRTREIRGEAYLDDNGGEEEHRGETVPLRETSYARRQKEGSSDRNDNRQRDSAAHRAGDASDKEDTDEEADTEDPNAPLVGGGSQRRNGRRQSGPEKGMPGSDASEKQGAEDPMVLISRAVPETDDPTLPTLTFRVFVIGTFFCILGAGISQLFFYKSNSPSFSSYFVILVSLPLGKWMAKTLPHRQVSLFGFSYNLNAGPFSIKEHLLIGILASSGATSAYASDIINIQELYFGQHMGVISSLTLLITTQTIGFGFAGLVHDLLVKPVAMLFPGTLVTTTMFNTLHAQRSVETKSRLFFFAMAFIAIFLYQFLPALIMPTLSSLALLCLVDNRIPAFRVLSSGYKGFGLPNLSFDWTAIATSGPLYQPWWAAMNFYIGIAGAMYLVMPVLYFSNFWDAQKFPSAIDSGLYENKNYGKFDIVSLLKDDHTLDWDKFQLAKPVLLTPWFAIVYGISFAVLTSMITHVFLWHRQDVVKAIRNPRHDDIHNRLMRAYESVPRKWYLITLGASLSTATVLVASSPLQLPVWGLFLAVSMSLIFLVPAGIVKAVSDTSIGLNVITEFVAGLLMPGKPIANVCFKCYGYMAMSQALDLVADLKLAHYMKIPPKDMFLAQLTGTVIGCVVNLAVVRLVLNPAAGYRGFLDGSQVDPTAQWDGRKVRIFYSASIIWGAIGPVEFFSGKYRTLFWGFALGAILPVIPWLLNKRWPRSYWRLIHFPVLLHGAGAPPQIPTNIIMSGFAVAWLSQYWARLKHPKWFARRNYVLAAALDAGSSVNALCVFLLSITILKVFPMPRWFMNPGRDAEHCTPE